MAGIDPSVQNIREQFKLWRRRIISGVIVLTLAILAIAQFVGAARLALEAALGPIGSRMLVGAALCVIILLIGAATWKLESVPAKDEEHRQRVSAIVDAITLGYGLAQDLKASFGFGKERKAAAPEDVAAEAAQRAAADAEAAKASAAGAKESAERAEKKATQTPS